MKLLDIKKLKHLLFLYRYEIPHITNIRCSSFIEENSINVAPDGEEKLMATVLHHELIFCTDEQIKIVGELDHLFENFFSLQSVDGLLRLDTSDVKSISHLFYRCRNLTDISGLQFWNTSNIERMDFTFMGCKKLSNISPLQGWKTENVVDAYFTFAYCSSIKEKGVIEHWTFPKMTLPQNRLMFPPEDPFVKIYLGSDETDCE